MSSERAGTPTHGHLDREATRKLLSDRLGEGDWRGLLDALEACVVLDPRLARIEALFNDDTWWGISEHRLRNKVHKILRGDQ